MGLSLAKTSWSNARVKLQFQVHFGVQKDFGLKKLLGQKKISSQKNLGKKKLVQNFFGTKLFWTQQFFLTQNLFGPQMHLKLEFDSGVGPTCFLIFSILLLDHFFKMMYIWRAKMFGAQIQKMETMSPKMCCFRYCLPSPLVSAPLP